jgi:FKBP-type peptidyl-prolyl cis-trans isomerase FkpA
MLSVAAALLAAAATPAAAANPAIIPLPLQPMVPAAQRTCTAKTATGLGYSVLRAAEGPKAGANDYVLINYIGYLAADGQVFDQAMTTPMQVDAVIPGFSEGLKMVPRGAVYRLCIPAALGYGAEGTGPIPANADLVFQIELLDSRTQAEVAAMQSAASAASAKPEAAPGK